MLIDTRLRQAVSQAQADFFMDDTNKYPGFVTGYGGGKTHAGCVKSVRLTVINKGLPFIIAAPDYPRIKRIIWPTLFDEVLPAMGMTPRDYRFVMSNSPTLYLPWGSEIWFMSAENPRKIVGSNVGGGYGDEVGLWAELAWQNFASRIRHPAAMLLQLFATFTPENRGWIDEKWGAGELYDKPLPAGYALYQGETADNVFLPETYETELLTEWGPEEAQARVYGRFSISQAGRVYYSFDKENYAEMIYDPEQELVVCFDFNDTPGMHVVLAQQHDEEFYVIDEIYQRGLKLEGALELIVKRYGYRQTAPLTVYGDATGRSSASQKGYYHIIRQVLSQNMPCPYREDVPTANPSVKDSVAAVNSLLCNARGDRRLFIHPQKCPRLKADMLQCITKAEKAKQLGRVHTGGYEIDKSNGRLTHASDALRYWIARVRPQRTAFERQTVYHIGA